MSIGPKPVWDGTGSLSHSVLDMVTESRRSGHSWSHRWSAGAPLASSPLLQQDAEAASAERQATSPDVPGRSVRLMCALEQSQALCGCAGRATIRCVELAREL